MYYMIPLISAFIVSFVAIGCVRPIAIRAGLVDSPNARKQHVGQVPLIGGLAIYLAVLTTSMLFIPHSHVLNIYLLASSMMLFIGVLDDRYDLAVSYRLVAQMLVAAMMIFGAEYYIKDLGNLLGLGVISLGIVGVFVTTIAVIGAINAFNMVDGIDGLAGSLSVITFTALFSLLYLAGSHWCILPLLFIAALLAYLMFNLGWPSKLLNKVFMGDAGSMLIGFTIVWLLVVSVDSSVRAFRPVTALYLIAIPLMDMVAIMYRRVKKGESPFKPDRDHLHHIFIRAGFTSKQALVLISVCAACIALLGVFGEIVAIPELIMLSVFLLIFLLYCYVIQHIWQILSWFRKFSRVE
ncbi:UDP-N-acetylglucosamine--undecaprenyl-phosphate N-acetylglucosaminephosphotransferase [Shewanella baltica]|uniref:UDP-N-acetylglucosamine--undecaprenyl-phosphate N-acetylglucosaminephosphotransferase n=1 Tax=Shewanella baltica TaxID=62322 RepID=UPI00217D0183|nr:UDP-N-acetylglucosamine--undecaprenyl-phosphate N-acetylglucosaminephosphotransferase [Shewanella baltica]MCS6238077.1 UDP-N-acetylglucosamine--undecaprenyl-phosphate N-acetylglucosaminephosphotransferase [Shewanella baltica]